MLRLWLGIGGSADPTTGDGIVGADSSCGKASELLAADGSGAGTGTGEEYLRGSGVRGGTSGTGADAASGAGWISVLGSGMGYSEICASGSGVGDAEGSAWGSGAGVSGLGDSEGSGLAVEESIGSGMLLLSNVGLGPLLSWSGTRGLLSTDGCPNIGPDKSRDLSKSSRDGKD